MRLSRTGAMLLAFADVCDDTQIGAKRSAIFTRTWEQFPDLFRFRLFEVDKAFRGPCSHQLTSTLAALVQDGLVRRVGPEFYGPTEKGVRRVGELRRGAAAVTGARLVG